MKKISLAILLVLHGMLAIAQTDPAPGASDWEKKLFISEYAIPLLIEAAITNSPELENAEATRQSAQEQRKITKKAFFSNFSLNSGYTYGTWNNFNINGEAVNSLNAFDAPLRARYNMGISMSLPLGQLVSRHNQLKIQDLTIAQVDANKRITERGIRQQVITLYQTLVLAKSQLELQQQAYQSAVISHELAEKQFRSGEIQIDVMSNVQQTYTSMTGALQSAKVNYETTLLMLEETIGTRIIDLIQSK
ncbi:TolC family protein [Pontibacter beigongshangensis]|uniref:TolC family protein n=1 Tax=Pontibacter beigongshangensis TaxID=2574733 RepID=UPI0016502307|nr:TolC family protein [Pontibacter beigongshangensis]